jgi:hypothetical protein
MHIDKEWKVRALQFVRAMPLGLVFVICESNSAAF